MELIDEVEIPAKIGRVVRDVGLALKHNDRFAAVFVGQVGRGSQQRGGGTPQRARQDVFNRSVRGLGEHSDVECGFARLALDEAADFFEPNNRHRGQAEPAPFGLVGIASACRFAWAPERTGP